MNLARQGGLSGSVEIRLPASHSSFGLEWHVEVGQIVEEGQLLAWLAVPDHCALLPLKSPAAGRISARWTHLLASGAGGAIVAELDTDGTQCRHSERQALHEAIDRAKARLASLPPASPLAALIAGERSALERWIGEAEVRLRALSG